MMKQMSKYFKKCYLGDDSTSTQLNDFLLKHPNYTVDEVSFDNPKGTCIENLFVVFNVADKATDELSCEQLEQGHWIMDSSDFDSFTCEFTVKCHCSNCGENKKFAGVLEDGTIKADSKQLDNFCSNCGLKMEEQVIKA